MEDVRRICLACGEIMNDPTDDQIKRFGRPECCGMEMVAVNISNIHAILKGIDKLKTALEKELIKGFGVEQYLDKK